MDPKKLIWDEKANKVTHNKTFFEYIKSVKVAHPDLMIAGPSLQWIRYMLDETAKIPEFSPKVSTPILLTQAGQDELVLPGGQKRFCELAKDCTLKVFPEARHEIFREAEPLRIEWKQMVLKHFETSALSH